MTFYFSSISIFNILRFWTVNCLLSLFAVKQNFKHLNRSLKMPIMCDFVDSLPLISAAICYQKAIFSVLCNQGLKLKTFFCFYTFVFYFPKREKWNGITNATTTTKTTKTNKIFFSLSAWVYLSSCWPGWLPNRQCLLGTLLVIIK